MKSKPKNKSQQTWKPGAWKPVRRGATYCSLACGYGCTHAAFLEAHEEAKKTIATLKTKGWKAKVWENIGWHWALTNTICGISLHANRYNPDKKWHFSTLASSVTGSSHGDMDINFVQGETDPNRAIAKQIKQVRPVFQAGADALEALNRFGKLKTT